MIVERFDIERLRLCVKLMISESVSQYDIVLGIIVCPCEVVGYFQQALGWENAELNLNVWASPLYLECPPDARVGMECVSLKPLLF